MKQFFTKKLIMLLLMVVGANAAWAETVSGTLSFAAQNRITKNDDGTFTSAGNAGNQYALALADLSGLDHLADITKITVEFDAQITGRLVIGIGDKATRGTTAGTSSKSTYDTNGLIMRYGKIDNNYVRVNGGTNNSDAIDVISHVSVTLDRTKSTYSYTITSEDGNTTFFSGSNIATTISNASVIEAYTWANSQKFALSDVSYTYEYSLSQFNYSISAVDGDGKVLKTLKEGQSEETVTYYKPYIINVEGKYYISESKTHAVEANATNNEVKVTYIENPNIVAAMEVETGANCGQDAAGNYSNGFYGHVNGGKTSALGTLEPGVYTAYAYLAERGDRGIYFRNTNKANTENVLANMGTVRASAVGEYTCEFTLMQSTPVGLSGYTSGTSTNQSSGIDYVYIVKTGEAKATCTVSSVGWATFCAPADFEVANADEVYYAKSVGESSVLLTALEAGAKVKAGEGVLVKTEGEHSFTLASDATAIEGNLLIGAASATELGEGEAYILANQDGNAVFALCSAGTIAAGKAYLPASIAGAPTLQFVFDNEATSIQSATEATVCKPQTTGSYNLAGQRVANGYKGIVIKNGVKVLNK